MCAILRSGLPRPAAATRRLIRFARLFVTIRAVFLGFGFFVCVGCQPFGFGHGDEATAQRGAVDQHHARAAITDAAAILGAGQIGGIAQRP